MLPSSTVENYLKAIYAGAGRLGPGERLVPMGQLASAVGVAPGTATTMVKTLAESGLVEYEPYAGVALTAAGQKLAALVLRRHRLIELFLVRVMGYSWDEVHDEAEQLEHVVSDRLIDRIDEMLGRPEADPHGDPIPNAEGLVKPQDSQTLLTCPLARVVTVTRVMDQDREFLRFIEQHNLKPGETIEVEARDTAADSVRVRGRNDQRITIGTRAASKLLVQVAHVLLLVLAAPPLAQAIRLGVALIVLFVPTPASAQTVGVLRGVVQDSLGGALAGAMIHLSKDVTGFARESTSNAEGTFTLGNLPLDSYELRVEFPGFKPFVQRVTISTSVPVELVAVLEVAAQTTSLTVRPETPLVDTTSTGTRTSLSMARIEQLPAAVGSRGLESVLVTFPGFAQNANGAIHPRGAHNQMTFVVDGLPISDQLTGAFANALDAGVVQTVELMTGNVPAEFGSKVSGVAVVTSRSGLGTQRRLAGDVMLSVAGFDTWHGSAQMGGGSERFGYFGSVSGMRTDRFLDQVSLDNLHNSGAFGRGFFRIDFLASQQDVFRVQAMGGRSGFEVANLRSQALAGQDQEQTLGDGAAWLSYLRTLNAQSTFESTAGYRAATARLDPSAGDTPVTAEQRRRLGTLTASARYTRLMGAHTWRAGADVQRFPVREAFSMAITSPTFNDPTAPDFNPSLLPHDLSRGGSPFVFSDARTGRLVSGFAQGTTHWGPLTLTLGLRHDDYSFLVHGAQLQPRVGFAYRLPDSIGVLRGSFNRNYQTPPNENLLLSSSPEASALAPESVKAALGGSYKPIRPERQLVYELGFQRAIGRLATLDLSLYQKRSLDQQDNNNFFDTGIIFPTTLAAIDARGAEMRLTMPTRRRMSGTLSVTMGRAVSTPPFTGGLFLGQDAVDLLSSGPFRIDHDQKMSVHGTLQYSGPGGVWVGGSVRFDSGLVSNPSDPNEVAADPDFADLLPYVDLTADVPRVRPRTIADISAGYDQRAGGRRVWSAQIQVTNLTNRTALYNFQSVFVGTRLVQPRTVAVRLKRFF